MSGTDLFPNGADLAEIQNVVNATADVPDLARTLVIEACELGTAAWPQYRGHLETEHVLVRIPQRVETKGGLLFEKGDVTLARRHGFSGAAGGWTAWSIRGNCGAGLRYAEVLK